jgi:predicted permease
MRHFWQRRRSEEDFAAEIRAHIVLEADRLVETGMAPAEALDTARRSFGNVTRSRERFYEARRPGWLDSLAGDLRLAVRRLRREPRTTGAAVATAGVCIGAAVTIFAVVDAVLLRPLPFPDPDRLVRIFNTYPTADITSDQSSFTNYYERRGMLAGVADLAIYHPDEAVVGDAGATEREEVLRVSSEFFRTLGTPLAIGRAFTDAEMTFQTDDVVILSDAYWRQHLAAGPDVVGRAIQIDGVAKRVTGVLPPTFRFLSSRARLYLPLSSNPDRRGPNQRYDGSVAEMIGRLNPGVSIAEAQAQIDAHGAAVERERPFPQFARMREMGFRAQVVPLHADHVQAVRPALLLLQGGVLFLLLVGGLNLATLLVVRLGGRMKELAVHHALGAGRLRVARQVVVETLLLVIGGGVLGVAGSAAGIALLIQLGARQLPLGDEVTLDGRVVLAALLGSLLVGLFLAAPLAWFAVRRWSAFGLRLESRGATAALLIQRFRHGCSILQIALAFVLCVGAALLGATLDNVGRTSPGFEPDGVLTARLVLPFRSYSSPGAVLAFLERLIAEIEQQPGFGSVAVSTVLPFAGPAVRSSITVEGAAADAATPRRAHYQYGVVGDYWAVMGIRLLEGRLFTSPREAKVCVVDEDFVGRNFPDGRAVGRRLSYGPVFRADDTLTIVGVVGAVKQGDLADTTGLGTVYYPFATLNSPDVVLVVRTPRDPVVLAPLLRATVRRLDPALPLDDVTTMRGRIDDSLLIRRTPAVLAGLFATIALLLASIGAYGVVAYAAAQRRREIALRLVLGASRGRVLGPFFRLGATLLLAGVAVGALGVWGARRALATLLFGVAPLEPAVLGGAVVVMAAIVMGATLLPSVAAAGVSPMTALKDE